MREEEHTMIVIDGRQSAMRLGNFSNLEEILVKVMEEELKENHVVTDVLINNEAFSELYPHQAEDISSGEIHNLEVRTTSFDALAEDMTQELFKVIRLMQHGGKRVALLFRQGDTAEALEVLQDLLDVTRHFLGIINVLYERFPASNEATLLSVSSSLDTLLNEKSDVMVNQDWILLADLLEYEFLPSCDNWNEVLTDLGSDIASAKLD